MAVEVFDNVTSLGTSTNLVEPASATDIVLQVTGASSTTLQTGEFRAIMVDPSSGRAELVMVTDSRTSLWQVDRGIENTTPLDFPAGSLVKHVYTAGAHAATTLPNPGSPDEILTIRSDGTLMYSTPMRVKAQAWGVDPSFTSAANSLGIQNAITQARANSGRGRGGGAAGGGVDLPPGVIPINKAVLIGFNTSLYAPGSRTTKLIADKAGDFTNGTRSQFSAMLKWDGGDAWAHGVHVENIEFDVNGVPGLSATWFEAQGENSKLDNLVCSNTVATKRSVSDAQIVFNNTTLTFAASTVTDDDVNAIVTDRPDGDFTKNGPAIPAYTKIDRINWTDIYANPPETTSSSVVLSNTPTASVSGSALSIYRPADAFVFDMGTGGDARGYIGSLNGVNNSGALCRIKNFSSGTLVIESLSGDSCIGGLLRISRAGSQYDPCHVTVLQIKSENDWYNPNWQAAMDPVVLLDRCATIGLNLVGGTFLAAQATARDVIRIDSPVKYNGIGPSIETNGIEGVNWYNPSYSSIIRDSSTGESIPSSHYGEYPTFPKILWGRNLLLGGGARCPKYERWQSGGIYYTHPRWSNCFPNIASAVGAPVPYAGSVFWYNSQDAQHDSMTWLDDISPGTYDLTFVGVYGSTNAIVTVDFGVHVYAPPAQPQVTVAAGGSIPAGINYLVFFTIATRNGESYPSPAQYFASDGTQKITIASPPTPEGYYGSDEPIGYYVYVGNPGTGTGIRQQSAPIAFGAGYELDAAPSTTGAALPITDTSGIWTPIGTLDTYKSFADLAFGQFTNIHVPIHNGPVHLRYSVLARNASSTGWLMQISGRHWQRVS